MSCVAGPRVIYEVAHESGFDGICRPLRLVLELTTGPQAGKLEPRGSGSTRTVTRRFPDRARAATAGSSCGQLRAAGGNGARATSSSERPSVRPRRHLHAAIPKRARVLAAVPAP